MCCFLEWGNTELKLGSPAHLFINVNVPSEVRSEVLYLCADVFLHHGDQRDPELFQLGLQRGQLRGLLPKETRQRHQVREHLHVIFMTWNTLSFTSLHKNHPGRRTAMTTAPFISHRLFALMTLFSTDKTRESVCERGSLNSWYKIRTIKKQKQSMKDKIQRSM